MDAPIVVASIAASVSVATVVANLFIARQGRQVGFKQLAFATALKAMEASLQAIREIASHTERVRIACWSIHRALDASPDEIKRHLTAATDELEATFRGYFDDWAGAKAEIPNPYLEWIQRARHDSRNKYYRLLTMLKIYLDGKASVPIDRNDVYRRVTDLQSDLQVIFSKLAEIKDSILLDLLKGADPRP